MRVKPWAVFRTDLPDDQVEKGDEIVAYGGRNVAVALGEIFTLLGCEVAETYSVEEQGWEFLVSYRGRKNFSCRVSSFHPAFRLLFEEVSLVPKVFRNGGVYAELARWLAAALDEDPRFHDITWWTWEEGPPEPDDVSAGGVDTLSVDDSDVPIAGTAFRGSELRNWSFVLALYMIPASALAFKDWFWGAQLTALERQEHLTFGLVALAVGTLALWICFRPKVER
jgi:hypothetical protein